MISVSTNDVAASDRQAFWADVVCAHLVQAECDSTVSAHQFEGRIDHWLLPGAAVGEAGVSVSRIRSHAQCVRRGTRHLASATQEQVLVNIQRQGTGVVRQDGREALLRPGDWTVYTSDRPYEPAFDAAFEQTVVILPAQAVRESVLQLHRFTAQRMSAAAPMGGLLREAAQRVVQGGEQPVRSHVGAVLNALLAAAMAEQQGQPQHRAVSGEAGCGRRLEAPSARESEVLHLVARGMTYEDIARHLAVSITTVRSHVRGLYGKLGVHNKTEAVFEAQQCGWLK